MVLIDQATNELVPRAHVTKPDAKRARTRMHELLADVGTGTPVEEALDLAFYLRRPLRPAEIDALDPAWLQIPAIDMGNDLGAAPYPTESPIRLVTRPR